MAETVAIVVIGRNEGARLIACLDSLEGSFEHIVYVDSGSTDGSAEAAIKRGANVVDLDMSIPFSAARARNAGIERLAEAGLPEFVQFIDGDCVLDQDWIPKALSALTEMPRVGILTGWRTEVEPDASIYTRMAEHEWHRPAGDAEACGGDMIVRRRVLEATGGFTEMVVAAEDDEFCIRARAAGWRVYRLPIVMTYHNLGMTTFTQWWKRAERTGHGYAQVGHLHRGYFQAPRRRVMLYGLALPVLIVIAMSAHLPVLAAFASLTYVVSWVRTSWILQRDGASVIMAVQHALFLSLSRLPEMIGFARYYWRRITGKRMQLIEYK